MIWLPGFREKINIKLEKEKEKDENTFDQDPSIFIIWNLYHKQNQAVNFNPKWNLMHNTKSNTNKIYWFFGLVALKP